MDAAHEGGLDHIAWELERYSWQHIEISGRALRRPLILTWGLF